ncbi:MAG: Gfo/Idh/MocA family oxidoreductase [Micromonosporaceae bacterium]|nr:Gfo/Idh/MocA family oxidoreductase [Micromonosporaceae bacterium]
MTMTPHRPWKVAVAGCGAAAFGIHLPILTDHPAFEVIGVCDRDPQRARVAADRFGIPRTAETATDLLAEADLLVILTGVHHELIDEALAAGVNVFTEKPVTLCLEQTRHLRDQADRAGLLLEVGAMRAFDPSLHAMLTAVPQPVSGLLIKADGADEAARRAMLPAGFAPYTFTDDPPQPTPDLDEQQLRALQILLWQGYHLLTALVMAAGDPQPVACALDRAGERVHAIVRDAASGALFTVVIGDAPAGVFEESMRLNDRTRAATLSFARPYQPTVTTSLTCEPASDAAHGAGEFGDPFAAMWNDVARSLAGQPRPGTRSIDLAERIETLARRLATITTGDDHDGDDHDSDPRGGSRCHQLRHLRWSSPSTDRRAQARPRC